MCKKPLCLATSVFILIAAGNTLGDLVARWKMDEGGGNIVADSSGNGYDGTLNGTATWTTGQFGLALHFDGSSTYAQVPASQNLDLLNHGDFSVSVWLMIDEIPAEYRAVLQQTDAGGTGRTWLGYTQGDFYNYHGAANRFAGVTPEAQRWYHVAYVVTEGGSDDIIQWYIDGEPTNSEATSVESNDNGDYLIGCHKALGNFWPGLLDDLRLYNHALTQAEVLAAMEGAGATYPQARGPDPGDGDLVEATWANLNWRAGDFAATHDVYLGDNYDDVDAGAEGTFVGNQTTTTLVVGFPGFPVPDGLIPGTTYYWRIDEVNEADPNSPWKGNVWSFSIPPKTAYWPDPADGAGHVDPNTILTWTGGYGVKLHTVYLGDSYDEVNNAAGGMALASATFDPGTLEREKVLYWRVDEFDGFETHKGDIWSFTTPGAVGNPQPANGAADVQMIETLSWTAADNATSHELYFGTDAEAVKNATTASPEYVGPKALGAESYDPGGLTWDSGYAWRVDEVYPDGPVRGLVWTFNTADFISVDDFESYNDIDPPDEASNRIFDKWIDGFGTTTNGALVGNDLPPYAEQGIVHGGAQSMVYRYDNANKTSEATLTLVHPLDWTTEGVTRLSLWFRGAPVNAADTMFVALNSSSVVYHDDASATQVAGWHEWIIDLSAFGGLGVDLTNINTITIGIGTKNAPAPDGGTGTLYFDDIRLIR